MSKLLNRIGICREIGLAVNLYEYPNLATWVDVGMYDTVVRILSGTLCGNLGAFFTKQIYSFFDIAKVASECANGSLS